MIMKYDGILFGNGMSIRKIIGWAYRYRTAMTAELAVKAVENACINVTDALRIILHSNLGTQYTSDQFEKYLSKRKIYHSFSRKGSPYGNSCIDFFLLP